MIEINKLTKFYYTISDVSSMFKINDSTLRYWETEFALLKPKKNRKGDRRYTKEDILIVDKIYMLLKEKGFTIKGANEELKAIVSSEKANQKALKKLSHIKKELIKIQEQL